MPAPRRRPCVFPLAGRRRHARRRAHAAGGGCPRVRSGHVLDQGRSEGGRRSSPSTWIVSQGPGGSLPRPDTGRNPGEECERPRGTGACAASGAGVGTADSRRARRRHRRGLLTSWDCGMGPGGPALGQIRAEVNGRALLTVEAQGLKLARGSPSATRIRSLTIRYAYRPREAIHHPLAAARQLEEEGVQAGQDDLRADGRVEHGPLGRRDGVRPPRSSRTCWRQSRAARSTGDRDSVGRCGSTTRAIRCGSARDTIP